MKAKATKPAGYIISETSEMVVVVTLKTDNSKTGNMLQVWVLDARMHPSESIKSGADASNQCAGCPFASGKGCYVTQQPLIAIWHAYKRGSYPLLTSDSEEFAEIFSGALVRFGAYGNPSEIPLELVEKIASLARAHTGYFHNWALLSREDAMAYGRFFMASVDSAETEQHAKHLGLRTFRVIPTDAPTPSEGIECLADSKGLTCSECRLCDGTQRSLARSNPLPSVWIRTHGKRVTRANASLSVR